MFDYEQWVHNSDENVNKFILVLATLINFSLQKKWNQNLHLCMYERNKYEWLQKPSVFSSESKSGIKLNSSLSEIMQETKRLQ